MRHDYLRRLFGSAGRENGSIVLGLASIAIVVTVLFTQASAAPDSAPSYLMFAPPAADTIAQPMAVSKTGGDTDSSPDVESVTFYRFLIGGAWTHSEEKVAEGIFTAALLFRTRWWDIYGEKNTDAEGFLDLLVDAQFITNQAFNQFSENPTDSSTTLLLNSVASSKLSTGVFLGISGKRDKSFLHDAAVFGLTARFEISTQEGSNDVFRRLILGFRMENRKAIKGAAIEVGVTVNRAPGSQELGQERGRVFRWERVVLDMELPMRKQNASKGLYIQFHGEWPFNGVEFRQVTAGSKEVAPPIYQFRLGATFDPLDIFGPLFGSPK
jgi:hypothetical protein